jgi:hypothetical protein
MRTNHKEKGRKAFSADRPVLSGWQDYFMILVYCELKEKPLLASLAQAFLSVPSFKQA